jgi:mannose-6-phosphate isomerase-like protein (cupin superfamily)
MDDDVSAMAGVVRHEDDCPVMTWDDHRGHLTFRTMFSSDATATQHFVTGVAELAPDGHLAHHRHAHAETYFVISGEGVVTLDGVEHPVRTGSNVFIPGHTEHGIRNTGEGTLRFFYALAADSFTEIEYVFS